MEGLWEMSLLPALGPADTHNPGCAAQGEDALAVLMISLCLFAKRIHPGHLTLQLREWRGWGSQLTKGTGTPLSDSCPWNRR